MPATAAAYAALLSQEATVTQDQATLLADTTTQTASQAAFASSLTPGTIYVYVPAPPATGPVQIITPDSSPQGFTVTSATVLT